MCMSVQISGHVRLSVLECVNYCVCRWTHACMRVNVNMHVVYLLVQVCVFACTHACLHECCACACVS